MWVLAPLRPRMAAAGHVLRWGGGGTDKAVQGPLGPSLFLLGSLHGGQLVTPTPCATPMLIHSPGSSRPSKSWRKTNHFHGHGYHQLGCKVFEVGLESPNLPGRRIPSC